jgi:hypothetical protein
MPEHNSNSASNKKLPTLDTYLLLTYSGYDIVPVTGGYDAYSPLGNKLTNRPVTDIDTAWYVAYEHYSKRHANSR